MGRGVAGDSRTGSSCCMDSSTGMAGMGDGKAEILVGETIAVVSAMLCEDDVNAAVHDDTCNVFVYSCIQNNTRHEIRVK